MNFKSKFFIFVFILCILLTTSSVCATDGQVDIVNVEDNNQLGQGSPSIDEDILNEEEDDGYSFDDLHHDIMNSSGTFDMSHDYTFNENDDDMLMSYDIEELTWNGNGYAVDGAYCGYGFAFYNGDDGEDAKEMKITINNVTFKNFDEKTLDFTKGNVTLNNVNFINCINNISGIIHASDYSDLTLNNVNFDTNNTFNFIETEFSKLTVLNMHLYGDNCTNSAISLNRGELIIDNSTFENFKSRHGAIINAKVYSFSLKNSKFINSEADFAGGAILAKFFPMPVNQESTEFLPFDEFLIENCEFTNLKAGSDGGVIYLDLDSGSQHLPQSLNITNSTFTDCNSRYGGVIAIQGGSLNIKDSNFTNNYASFEGGAIFSSWTNVCLINTTINNNAAEKNAGAIYFDKGKLTINQTRLIGNKLINGSENAASAIYAHDVDAYFLNSIFNNGGVSVYADFASNSKLENITKNDDIFLMDNKNYVVSVESNGIKLNFTKNEIIVDKLPSKFDLRDWGWVSPIKIQSSDNDDCWAFATVASLESALLKATGQYYNLSANYIQKLQLKYAQNGDLRISLTGFGYSGLGYALSWIGALPMDSDYDDRGLLVDTDLADSRIHLQDAIIIQCGQDNTNELIKQAIMKYGSVTVQLIFTEDIPELNTTGEDIAEMNHNIHYYTIIGWDDNYTGDDSSDSEDDEIDPDEIDPDEIDPDEFVPDEFNPDEFDPDEVDPDEDDDSEPKSIGAWITKESLAGFEYIFYNDERFMRTDYYAIIPQNAAIAYIFENNIDYHVNYQTDLTALSGFDSNYTHYSNEFVSKYNELIGAVGTYFNESGINYSFDIYVNGVKVHTQNGVSEFGGFRTIILNKYIPVKVGDKFKVVFKNNNVPFQAYSRQHYMSGMTFVSADGKSWKDITPENRTVCLKVYTVKDDTKIINNKDISVDYAGGSYFSVKVVTADGRAVGAGAVVKFTINGKTTTVKTDSNGIAKLKISNLPKKYTITTSYNGKTYKNAVTVKQVLTTKKVTVKKTAKKFTLQAKLKINGKLVKGKVIKFKFKGKTYKVKTNKKGIAKVTIKKKIIKKLKKGKKYSVKVTYLKDTIKTTVKVK